MLHSVYRVPSSYKVGHFDQTRRLFLQTSRPHPVYQTSSPCRKARQRYAGADRSRTVERRSRRSVWNAEHSAPTGGSWWTRRSESARRRTRWRAYSRIQTTSLGYSPRTRSASVRLRRSPDLLNTVSLESNFIYKTLIVHLQELMCVRLKSFPSHGGSFLSAHSYLTWFISLVRVLPRDVIHSTDCGVERCLSVRPFVTRKYCVETIGYHTILPFSYQILWQYSNVIP